MIDWLRRRVRRADKPSEEQELAEEVLNRLREEIERVRTEEKRWKEDVQKISDALGCQLLKVKTLEEQLGIKQKIGQGGSSFDQLIHDGRGMNLSKNGIEFRNGEIWHMACDRKFPALLGLIVEIQDELDETTSDYKETPERKQMAGGGSAALRELLDRLREIRETQVEEEEETEKPK